MKKQITVFQFILGLSSINLASCAYYAKGDNICSEAIFVRKYASQADIDNYRCIQVQKLNKYINCFKLCLGTCYNSCPCIATYTNISNTNSDTCDLYLAACKTVADSTTLLPGSQLLEYTLPPLSWIHEGNVLL